MASSCFPPFTVVDAACCWRVSLAHRPSGCCGLPDPVMKAFRCLETYYFPQLCIPELHSDEACLYHSHAYLETSFISAQKDKLYLFSLCKFQTYKKRPTLIDQLVFFKETLNFQLFCKGWNFGAQESVFAVEIWLFWAKWNPSFMNMFE